MPPEKRAVLSHNLDSPPPYLLKLSSLLMWNENFCSYKLDPLVIYQEQYTVPLYNLRVGWVSLVKAISLPNLQKEL